MGSEPDIGSAEENAPTGSAEDVGFLTEVVNEIVSSPINIALVLAIFFLIYKILMGRRESDADANIPPQAPPLPKLKKRDMTLQELLKFDGTQPDGRVLVAINGKIFDVTRGKRFYGPGGPYSPFAGHDASRALAFFQADLVKDEYDDLSDLDSRQMESVREWEEQFTDKYDFVGRLLKPGEEPNSYSDEEETEPTEEPQQSTAASTERTKDD